MVAHARFNSCFIFSFELFLFNQKEKDVRGRKSKRKGQTVGLHLCWLWVEIYRKIFPRQSKHPCIHVATLKKQTTSLRHFGNIDISSAKFSLQIFDLWFSLCALISFSQQRFINFQSARPFILICFFRWRAENYEQAYSFSLVFKICLECGSWKMNSHCMARRWITRTKLHRFLYMLNSFTSTLP